MKKNKIIMIMPLQSSFIKNDIKILSSQYTVVQSINNWKNKYFIPLFMILQLFIILKHIRDIKSIVIEFGGYWAVIPSIFGKMFNIPVFIILHGTECAILPHVQYGSLRKKLVRLSCKISYHFASMLLPVSDSLIYVKNDYNSKNVLQGVKYHLPKIKTPFCVIYNGLDLDFWTPLKNISKDKKQFITVLSSFRFILKGGDLILLLAKKYSDCNFYIAGTEKLQSFGKIPNNVHFLGILSQKELRNQYRKSQFYFQLSMFEGFGLSLCEAMLCECIPIGSSVNIIPDIIGNTGFILNKRDEKELSNIVEEALSVKNKKELGQKSRERIRKKYSLKKREELLLKTINSYS